ncbi:uncharacterized protein [Periplaneta americana]|uniref:uncharacterized protein n=1 Tax=Periplaneta americana TaxID=6978 RepID=UPI0037E95875
MNYQGNFEIQMEEQMDSVYPSLYPLNRSLAEEVERLFSNCCLSLETEGDVMREFRLNGQDSDYPDSVYDSKPLPMSELIEAQKMITVSESTGIPVMNSKQSKKKTKKPIQECVFCKNNGEQASFYQRHVLKDSEGRVVCPILRAYICPICGANGDVAHTIKYCPKNDNTEYIPTMTSLKCRRTATGHKRCKP